MADLDAKAASGSKEVESSLQANYGAAQALMTQFSNNERVFEGNAEDMATTGKARSQAIARSVVAQRREGHRLQDDIARVSGVIRESFQIARDKVHCCFFRGEEGGGLNFWGLFLGSIDVDFCKQIFIRKLSPRST